MRRTQPLLFISYISDAWLCRHGCAGKDDVQSQALSMHGIWNVLVCAPVDSSTRFLLFRRLVATASRSGRTVFRI
jgi:hypothetical protein